MSKNYRSRKKSSTKPTSRAGKSKMEENSKDLRSSARNSAYDDCSHTSNDPAWYGNTPQLVADAASFAYSDPVGKALDLGNTNETDGRNHIPGLCTLVWRPSLGNVGVASGATAVNLAARNVYSFVRHANSGHANYDWPDLMMYIIAADQAFSAIAMGMRAYGIARFYTQRNLYTPTALLRGMGFDPASVQSNLAQFRYYLNLLVAKASVIWVPGDMSLIKRHFWMNSNIYADNPGPKAQYYMYVQNQFYKYNPTLTSVGGGLDVHNFTGTNTIQQYFDFVNGLLEPLITDEDMGIMAGDVLKAYGSDKIYSLNPIPEEYTIMPVFDAEVMTQIHNCDIVPLPASNIIQNTSGVIYEKSYETQTWDYNPLPRKLFDFADSAPSPEIAMVASRLKPGLVLAPKIDSTYTISVTDCGTEIVHQVVVWTIKDDGSFTIDVHNGNFVSTMNVPEICRLTQFDYAPFIYFVTNNKLQGILGDVNYYTTLSNSDLSKMHTTAVMSEFGVPAKV